MLFLCVIFMHVSRYNEVMGMVKKSLHFICDCNFNFISRSISLHMCYKRYMKKRNIKVSYRSRLHVGYDRNVCIYKKFYFVNTYALNVR